MSSKATILPNGPVKIEGEFQICDAAGHPFDLGAGKPVFLCRCGLSGKKPFCDGTHNKQGFQSEVKAE